MMHVAATTFWSSIWVNTIFVENSVTLGVAVGNNLLHFLFLCAGELKALDHVGIVHRGLR